MTNWELALRDGRETLDLLPEIQPVYHAAFPDWDLVDHARRTTAQAQSAGFATVTAHSAGELVGFVYGLPLSAEMPWWKGLDPAGPDGFTAENGSRTFAVIDLAVTPGARGRGLGRTLMDELLSSRTEERATLATGSHETNNQRMYERWGWHRVGRVTEGHESAELVFELYVIALR